MDQIWIQKQYVLFRLGPIHVLKPEAACYGSSYRMSNVIHTDGMQLRKWENDYRVVDPVVFY